MAGATLRIPKIHKGRIGHFPALRFRSQRSHCPSRSVRSAGRGIPNMVDDAGKPPEAASNLAARSLMAETGITEAQARALVAFLGPHNWSSLMREARLLKTL